MKNRNTWIKDDHPGLYVLQERDAQLSDFLRFSIKSVVSPKLGKQTPDLTYSDAPLDNDVHITLEPRFCLLGTYWKWV